MSRIPVVKEEPAPVATEDLPDFDGEAALDIASREVYRRLLDPIERARIPSHTLVRMAEVLEKQVRAGRHDALDPGNADPLEIVKGLPPERQAAALASLMGITTDEAASLLASHESATCAPRADPID